MELGGGSDVTAEMGLACRDNIVIPLSLIVGRRVWNLMCTPTPNTVIPQKIGKPIRSHSNALFGRRHALLFLSLLGPAEFCTYLGDLKLNLRISAVPCDDHGSRDPTYDTP